MHFRPLHDCVVVRRVETDGAAIEFNIYGQAD
jgi:hypothetical protein